MATEKEYLELIDLFDKKNIVNHVLYISMLQKYIC